MTFIFRNLQHLRNLLGRLVDRSPARRPAASETDWLPPVLAARDLSSPYFLAMADPGAGWYIERHHRHHH